MMVRSDDQLIQALSDDLAPVRRVGAPEWRLASWIAIIALVAIIPVMRSDLPATVTRVLAQPDMWLAVFGSATTALLAGLAAIRLASPDASRNWALLPLPAAALWIGASGLGCLRSVALPAAQMPTAGDRTDCLMLIVGFAIPIGAGIFSVLRRGYPLHPNLMTLVAGLGCAAASATLLVFVHPFQATAMDLGMHLVAVGIVIASGWLATAARRILFPTRT